MKGVIIASTCGVFKVFTGHQTYNCKPRGIFRHHSEKPLVGDIVEFDEKELVIENIQERKNSLIRPSIANVDEVAIVMSAVEPQYSAYLVNKFLSYASYFAIKANVILTKIDMVDKNAFKQEEENLRRLGVKLYYFSKKTLDGLDEIRELFKDKTIALMGQTGVGKSSLLNELIPESNREIGEYSTALGRGKHMTKEVVLIPYCDGFIADTPGFSSLELPFFKEDLAHHFPGFEKLSYDCKYANCLHINEKECMILDALKNGLIAQVSYNDYIRLLEELKFKKDRY